MTRKRKDAELCKKVLAWVLFLGISMTIFAFSHQTAQQSSEVSRTVLTQVLEKLIPGYYELPEAEQEQLIKTYHSCIRKIAHFGIYTLWGWSLSFLLALYKKRKKVILGIVLCGGLLYASGDEWHQMFINGRAAQLSDIFIDTVGSGFGFVCFVLLSKIKNYFSKYMKKALT